MAGFYCSPELHDGDHKVAAKWIFRTIPVVDGIPSRTWSACAAHADHALSSLVLADDARQIRVTRLQEAADASR